MENGLAKILGFWKNGTPNKQRFATAKLDRSFRQPVPVSDMNGLSKLV